MQDAHESGPLLSVKEWCGGAASFRKMYEDALHAGETNDYFRSVRKFLEQNEDMPVQDLSPKQMAWLEKIHNQWNDRGFNG